MGSEIYILQTKLLGFHLLVSFHKAFLYFPCRGVTQGFTEKPFSQHGASQQSLVKLPWTGTFDRAVTDL